jgi:hypothetical protein
MESKAKKILQTAIVGSILISGIAIAQSALSPYMPHAYINGYGGTGEADWLGSGDLLAPLFLADDKNLFLYGQARLSNQLEDGDTNYPYDLAFGAGYRQIPSFLSSQIFGLYVLANYMNSQYNNKYWNISPGIETLGLIDFRANGYIPIGDTKQTYNTYVFDHFQGHDEYDRLYENTEEESWGMDTEIGTRIFSIAHMPVKLYVSGYYFDGKDSDDVTGIGGRLTFQPTRWLTFELKDTYDNVQHNVFMGGIKFYLNGYLQYPANTNVDNQGLQQRLYDPIERNFGGIGSGTGIPGGMTFSHVSDYKGTPIVRDHIIFTEQGAGALAAGVEPSEDGTFENPYIYTSSDDMQVIADAAYGTFPTYSYLYFNSGTYDMGTNPTALYTNQSLWGRSADFSAPAVEGGVVFNGGFALTDTGSIGFHNFTLLNNDSFANGIVIDGAQSGATFTFDGITVGEAASDNMNPNSYQLGVLIKNITTGTANIDIDKSSFYGTDTTGFGGVGMVVDNDNPGNALITLAIDDSNFYGNKVYAGTITYNPSGLYIVDKGTGAVNISNITRSNFTGDWYGLLFEIDNNAKTATNINIGNIEDSTFTGTEDGGYGYSGLAIYYSTNSRMNVGNIVNSYFYGDEDGLDIEDYYNYGTPGINIGNITNSHFYGMNYIGFFLRVHGAEVNMGNITSSTFNSSYYDGFAIYAYDSPIYMGNIIDSTFDGGKDGAFGFEIAALYDIYIKNIINSDFMSGYAGFWADSAYTSVYIGNIIGSLFYSYIPYPGDNYYGAGMIVRAEHSINIGNIENTEFRVDNKGGSSYTQGIRLVSYNNDNIDIQGIENSTFNIDMTNPDSRAIDVEEGKISIGSTPYTTPEALFDALSITEQGTNTFSNGGKYVCISNICYPP